MLDVSFNSPQCGWMSIGFADGVSEFHTTTAHAPHELALTNLIRILTELADAESAENEFLLKWNRDPEEFDFRFTRDADSVMFEQSPCAGPPENVGANTRLRFCPVEMDRVNKPTKANRKNTAFCTLHAVGGLAVAVGFLLPVLTLIRR